MGVSPATSPPPPPVPPGPTLLGPSAAAAPPAAAPTGAGAAAAAAGAEPAAPWGAVPWAAPVSEARRSVAAAPPPPPAEPCCCCAAAGDAAGTAPAGALGWLAGAWKGEGDTVREGAAEFCERGAGPGERVRVVGFFKCILKPQPLNQLRTLACVRVEGEWGVAAWGPGRKVRPSSARRKRRGTARGRGGGKRKRQGLSASKEAW
jgi:hypothetical protein